MSGPATNFNAIMAGAIARIEVAAWAANYGATVFTDLGALKNIKDSEAIESQSYDADNVLPDIGELDQKITKAIKATLMQMDPRLKVQQYGKPTSDVVVVPKVGGTKGTVKYGFGVIPARGYFTVRLTVDNLAMILGLPTALTDVYDKYIVTLPKARWEVKSDADYSKKGVTMRDVTLKAFQDDTVTAAGQELWREEFQTAGT